MLVSGSITLSKGFDTWKAMVVKNKERLKDYGLTFVFAGTEMQDDSKLHVVMHFTSMENLQKFQADEELAKERAEAGAVLETSVMTPITDAACTNFPDVI